jgi:hypothetical protein
LSAAFDLELGFYRTDSKSSPETEIKSGGQESALHGQDLSRPNKKGGRMSGRLNFQLVAVRTR